MAEILQFKHATPGWVFILRWKTWIGGIICTRVPGVDNVINRELVIEGVAAGERKKPFIVLGVKRTDISYDAGTNTVTLVPSPTVKGWGYDSFHDACVKIRDTIIGDGTEDPGDLKRQVLEIVGTLRTLD